MIGLLGVLLALGLLIALAFRGMSVIVLGPVMAAVAVLFAPGEPLLANYTQVFMPALGDFIVAFFPLFLLGAVFGRLMDDSGYARAVSDAIIDRLGPRQAILATVLACAVLTYGGVSLFVVAFAIYPVANALFQAGEVPKRLLPGAIALGAFTFTMTALPGTPAIQNAIPMPYFGTTPFAAPGVGLIAAAIMFGGGLFWLNRLSRRAAIAGEGYGTHGVDDAPPRTQGAIGAKIGPNEPPPLWLASAPILGVIALNYLLSVQLFPRLDTAYLAQPQFGETTVDAVRGVWAIIVGLLAAIVFILATARERLADWEKSVVRGAQDSLLPIFNTASLVGFGAVVAGLPAFDLVRAGIDGVSSDPVVSLAISSSVLAGLTGSASGGMTIALDVLGESSRVAAAAQGVDGALLHRVVALATGGLDALPHNGAVVTLLAICGLTHRDAYGPIFMVAVAIPVAALCAALVMGSVFGAF